MKRRGFLKALFAAPAIPYVPALAAAPLSYEWWANRGQAGEPIDVIWEIEPEQTPFANLGADWADDTAYCKRMGWK